MEIKFDGPVTDEQAKRITRALVLGQTVKVLESIAWAAAVTVVLSIAIQHCTACGFNGSRPGVQPANEWIDPHQE